MKCLYCNLEAIEKEEYKGIPIRVCLEGHRTALLLDERDSKMDLKVA